MSPAAQVCTAYEAITFAEGYVRGHPGSDFAVGRGDSMLPLYRNRDVIILERPALSDLEPGQTVMFIGDDGAPVAHILVALTLRGPITRGLNSDACDPSPLRENAYIGVVVKALRPTQSVILAFSSVRAPDPSKELALPPASTPALAAVQGQAREAGSTPAVFASLIAR